MKMGFIKINPAAIAEGMFEKWSEDDKVIIAYGMIPKEWIDLLERLLNEKFDRMLECVLPGALPERDDFVREVSKAVRKEWYRLGCKI